MPDETPRNYWDSQQRVGQVSLSERDVLLVAKLQHGDDLYIRLQVHRRTVNHRAPVTTPGTKGVILPLAAVSAIAELLRQALASEERPPSLADRLRVAPDDEGEPF